MIKFFTKLAALLLVVSNSFIFPYTANANIDGNVNKAAIDTPTIAVAATALNENNEIDAVVSIENNPGIAAFLMELSFDKSLLTPISISPGNVLASVSIMSNIQSAAELQELTGVTAFWVNPANITSNGVLYSVKFKANPRISTLTQLTLSYNQGDIINSAFEDIAPELKGCSIELLSGMDFDAIIDSNALIRQDNMISGELSVNVVNNTEISETAMVICAIYDQSSRLVYTNIKNNTTLNKGNNFITFSEITVTNVAAPQYALKILVWKDSNSLQPLMAARSISI